MTAGLGVYLLAAAVQGWFSGALGPALRTILFVAAICMISGDWRTDLAGLLLASAVTLWQRRRAAGIRARAAAAPEAAQPATGGE